MSDIIQLQGSEVTINAEELKNASIETILKTLNYTEEMFKPLADYMANDGIPYYMILYGRFNDDSLYKTMSINVLKILGATALLFPPIRIISSGTKAITLVPKLIFSKGGAITSTFVLLDTTMKMDENNEEYSFLNVIKNAIIVAYDELIVNTFKLAKDGVVKTALTISEKIKKDGSVLVNGLPIYFYIDLNNINIEILNKNIEYYKKLRPDLLIIFEYITTQAKTNKFVDHYYFETLSLMKDNDPSLYEMVKKSIIGKQHIRQGFIRLVHNAMYYFVNSYEVTYDDFSENIDDVLPPNILNDFKDMILSNSLKVITTKKGKPKTNFLGEKIYKVVYDKSASQSYNIADVNELKNLTKAQFFNVNRKLQAKNIFEETYVKPQVTEKVIPAVKANTQSIPATNDVNTTNENIIEANNVVENTIKTENVKFKDGLIKTTKLTQSGASYAKKYGISTKKLDLMFNDFDPSNFYFSYVGSEPFSSAINNLDGNLLYNLNLMAYDYYNKYDKQFSVTSGFRSTAFQEKLYNDYINGKGNPANRPGYSLHEYGMAIDINSTEAKQLESNGMLSKYGFWRPIPNKEAWHIQPTTITDKSGDGMLELNNKNAVAKTTKKPELTKPKAFKSSNYIKTNNVATSNSGKYYSINIGGSKYASNVNKQKENKVYTNNNKIDIAKPKEVSYNNKQLKYAPEDTKEINAEINRLKDEFKPKANVSIPGDANYTNNTKGVTIGGDPNYVEEPKKVVKSPKVVNKNYPNISYKKVDDNTYSSSDGNFITKKTRQYDDGTKEEYYLTNTDIELTEDILETGSNEQFEELSGFSKEEFKKGINLINNKQEAVASNNLTPNVNKVESVDFVKKLGV